MYAIEVQDLKKTYGGEVEALRGISLTVEKGEVFGLLGPNGAGKTSTVRILTTMSPASSGIVRVMGMSVDENPQGVRRRIGYVAQNSGVDQLATGRENLELQARLFHLPASEIQHRVDELLDLFALTDVAGRAVKTYSGGMKRRLDVALSLIHRPEVLFLDEPTTGLDPESRITLWREMKRLAEREELTIFLTTHYLEEADQMVNRLAIVDHGEIIAQGTPDELKARLRGDVISVQLTENGNRPARAQSLVGQLEGINSTIVEGKSLFAEAAQGAQAVPMIVAALEAEGLGIQQVALSRPSLDEVYLTLTGRSYDNDSESETTKPA